MDDKHISKLLGALGIGALVGAGALAWKFWPAGAAGHFVPDKTAGSPGSAGWMLVYSKWRPAGVRFDPANTMHSGAFTQACIANACPRRASDGSLIAPDLFAGSANPSPSEMPPGVGWYVSATEPWRGAIYWYSGSDESHASYPTITPSSGPKKMILMGTPLDPLNWAAGVHDNRSGPVLEGPTVD